ncbi:MAG: class I SAM-dependent methyltransferase [Flavobacterium sp.]|nr:MAG: class I SAM-dependent methyltransferase [Flavobacterium sp.]
MSKCKICGSASNKVFDTKVIGRYKVDYFQCVSCLFIQTEEPFWLKEAYESAMTALDIGLVSRNIEFSQTIPPLLDMFSNGNDAFIDYGGGYGLFVRLMRDIGFNFYLYDTYAQNLYAKHFEISDYTEEKKFTCLTAFEVFEHLEDPHKEIKEMFKLSDTIIFSTMLQPQTKITSPNDWWYFVPEVGQHISLFSFQSLSVLSEQYKYSLYTNGTNLHVLSKVQLSKNPFESKENPSRSLISRGLSRIFGTNVSADGQISNKRHSLLAKDLELYRQKLQDSFLNERTDG